MNKHFYSKFLFAAFFVTNSVICAFAQGQPSAPIRPFVVKTQKMLADLEKSISQENKVEDLMGGVGLQLRVALQHDEHRDSAEAEVHDSSDDVFYVLKGTANLTIGGRLENPHETTPGEWRSAKIIDGQMFTIKKGDLIIVPRGTPHQRINAPGKEFSVILIKIFAEPVGAVR